MRSLLILGTRGIPASHGGFETFADRFARFMRDRGWRVTVYCQATVGPKGPIEDYWEGIRRITFHAPISASGTMLFDWYCVLHAMREPSIALVLGYNTAIFSALLRFGRRAVVTNMDGIEWKRAKWRLEARVWLYLNEWVGAATSSALIADHPEIARHLRRRGFKNNIIMIPYGADEITTAPESPVRSLGLEPGRYLLSVGRVEPENNTLMMVQAYARRLRKIDFVCLGSLNPKENRYHAEVMAAGEGRVLFPGAIYESEQVKALRFHAAAYCHGHSVGGTNPSLVESLGAGNAIVAHRNQFNSWVAGPGQLYFDSVDECARAFDSVEEGGAMLREAAWSSRRRHLEHFKWEPVLRAYEAVCERFVAQPSTCLLDFEC